MKINNEPTAVQRTIEEIYDVQEEKTYTATEFFSKSEHEIMHWRRALEEAILLDKPRLVCNHCKQMVKLCGRRTQRGVVSYFSHLYDSDECEIKTTTQLSREEIEARKYRLVQESSRHKELKQAMASLLSSSKSREIGITNVAIEQRINSNIPYMNWRRPDIQASYRGMNLVFELQLSTTFLSIVVDRDIFYRLNNYFIIWIFNFDDNKEYVNLHNLMCKDIYYANKRNIFIFDKRAQELSVNAEELILKCQWLDIEGNFTEGEYISISQLTFDSESYKPYYIDADTIYYNAHPGVKERLASLEKSRAELLNGIMERQRLQLEKEENERKYIINLKSQIIANMAVAQTYERNSKLGFAFDGHIISKPIYSSIMWDDSTNMFIIKKGLKQGLANRAGDVIIPCCCTQIHRLPLGNHYLVVEKKNWRIWGAKTYLKQVSQTDNYSVQPLYGNFLLIKFNFKERYASQRSTKVFLIFPNHQTLEISDIGIESDRHYVTHDNIKYFLHQEGYIYHNLDKNGVTQIMIGENMMGLNIDDKEALPPIYSSLHYSSPDSIFVTYEGGTGVVNSSNEVIIPLTFDEVTACSKDYYKAKANNAYGLYNSAGQQICAIEYQQLELCYQDSFIVCSNYKYGLISATGEYLIMPQYSNLQKTSNKQLIATQVQSYNSWIKAVIDQDNNQIIAFDNQYKSIVFDNGIYACCHQSLSDIRKNGLIVDWTLYKENKSLPTKIHTSEIKYIKPHFLIVSPYGIGLQARSFEDVPLSPIFENTQYKHQFRNLHDNSIFSIDEYGQIHYNELAMLSQDDIEETSAINNHVFCGTHNSKLGLYAKLNNNNIKHIIPFEFDSIENINGYFLCKKKIYVTHSVQTICSLWNACGKEIIPTYWNATSIEIRKDGIANITIYDKALGSYHVWLKRDFSLLLPWHNFVSKIGKFYNGIAEVIYNGTKAYIDRHGNRVKETIETIPNGLIKVRCFGKYGIDSVEKQEIIPCKYDEIELLPTNFFLANKHDVLTIEGKLVFSKEDNLTFLNKNLFIIKSMNHNSNENNLRLCDSTGYIIKSDEFSQITEKSGFILVGRTIEIGPYRNERKKILYGLYDATGKAILAANYKTIKILFDDYVLYVYKNECHILKVSARKEYPASEMHKVTSIGKTTYYRLKSDSNQILVDSDFNNLGEYKYISFDQATKKIIGTNLKHEKIDALTKEILETAPTFEIGHIYDGTIIGIKPYGAFVLINNQSTGLAHISSFKKLPLAFFKKGEAIKAKILSIEPDGKIHISINKVKGRTIVAE